MPGSVDNASPSQVMPNGLCSVFSVSREYLVDETFYQSGEHQIGQRTTTSRRRWRLSRALLIDEVYALRNFFRSVGANSFYFYDLVSDLSVVYDATGTLTTGRFTVRFEGGWSQVSDFKYTEVSLELVEVN